MSHAFWQDATIAKAPFQHAAVDFVKSVQLVIPCFARVTVEWRPPFMTVTDRLQKGPETLVKGVMRYRALWELGGRESMLQQAADFEGDVPSPEDVRAMARIALPIVIAMVKGTDQA